MQCIARRRSSVCERIRQIGAGALSVVMLIASVAVADAESNGAVATRQGVEVQGMPGPW